MTCFICSFLAENDVMYDDTELSSDYDNSDNSDED